MQYAPAIPVDVAHPAAFARALTSGFVAKLSATSHAAGSPEAELLANLQDAAGRSHA